MTNLPPTRRWTCAGGASRRTGCSLRVACLRSWAGSRTRGSSVIRRVVAHLACLAGPVMAALFIPIAVLAPKIYEWMRRLQTGEIDHSLHAKQPLFSMPMFYLTAVGCFVIWFVLSHRLRYWSLKQ